MAINDLDLLRSELPTLFTDYALPSDWEEQWAFIPDDLYEQHIHADGAPSAEWDGCFAQFESLTTPESGDNRFPGAPVSGFGGGKVPPPDALGFYLPFHYFHPTWWGIYLVAEGISALGEYLRALSPGVLSCEEAESAAKAFIYHHERFHHMVECFATRLEIAHRQPIYRTGFEEVYLEGLAKSDSLEESLASAHGYSELFASAFRSPHEDEKREAVLFGLYSYMMESPPAYRGATHFTTKTPFLRGRNALAEASAQESIPGLAQASPSLWQSFSHAFTGMSRANSRLNYVVRRDSALFNSVNAHGPFLRYRDIEKRLRGTCDCTPVRQTGSHVIWRGPSGQTFPVPRHPGEIARGTLSKIIKQAGLDMSLSQFVNARS